MKRKSNAQSDASCPCKFVPRMSETNPRKQFVLFSLYSILGKRPSWLSKTEPLVESKDPKLAMRFTAKFLRETAWSWELFYDAVPVTEHTKEIRKRERQRPR